MADRLVCLYGQNCGPFVEPAVRELQIAVDEFGAQLVALPIESAVLEPLRWLETERVYLMPFDLPAHLPAQFPRDAIGLVQTLFPRAQLMNSPVVHELCWDRQKTSERLLGRGVPMPDTLITHNPVEAREFVVEHGQAILKEPHGCGGLGHLVLFADDEGTLAGETQGRRYVVELAPEGSPMQLEHGVLSYPAPLFLQRLITGVGRRGVITPAQVLRAYIVDGQVMFWAERYRERCERPSDFVISVALGARYRFLRDVSEEVRKVALRAAEVLGVAYGVVDLIRTGSEGPYVLEVDTDGSHMLIDRQFKLLPDFRSIYDFDHFIAEAMTAPVIEPQVRRI